MIGRRIKAARAMKDMTQADLGREIGVFPQRICLMENGKTEASASELIALSDALGVSVEWLVRGNGAPEAIPVEVAK